MTPPKVFGTAHSTYLTLRTVNLGLNHQALQGGAQNLRDGKLGHGIEFFPGKQVIGVARLASTRPPTALNDIRARDPDRVQTGDLCRKNFKITSTVYFGRKKNK